MDDSSTTAQTRAGPRQAHSVDPAIALAMLRRCERLHWTKVWLSLGFGILLLPLGPLLINSVIWITYQVVNVIFRGRFDRNFWFWPHYWIVAAISLPILFLLAALARGSPLGAAAESSDESFHWAFLAIPLAMVEIGNIGPRLMFSAVRGAGNRRRVGEADLSRLAIAVAQLAAYDGAAPPTILLQPEEPSECLGRILPLLLFHDIVDISRTGDRVWICSGPKRRLNGDLTAG
jgi:hypothetical protein